MIGHRIEVTDRRIDRLVYELYGLMNEEIRMVVHPNPRRKPNPEGGDTVVIGDGYMVDIYADGSSRRHRYSSGCLKDR